MISYNIPRSLLPEASKITPGKTSPTVTNLEEEGMCAVSSLIVKGESATKMDQLMEVGATDILLFSISNSRM